MPCALARRGTDKYLLSLLLLLFNFFSKYTGKCVLTGNKTKSLNLASPSVLDGGSFVQPVWGQAGRPGTVPSAFCHTHFSSDVLGSFSCPRLLPFFFCCQHMFLLVVTTS